MAVGSREFPTIFDVPGVELGTVCAGIKQVEKDDLLIIQLAQGSQCAAVFTQNAFCAAPVVVAREHVLQNPRWLLVNSGNANAGTGEQGMRDALSSCLELAALVGGESEQVLPFSTGVIGEQLPLEKMLHVLPAAVADLGTKNWQKAADAIMTTDTFAKGASKQIDINGHKISISGISKGAGMIQPNMATMLAFVATDANINQALLQQCLQQAVAQSFNQISVDGDTSTNDACVLMATCQSAAEEITLHSAAYNKLSSAINEVFQQLAEAIVRDGEGASKLIRISVEEAQSEQEADQVARTIAHSPLVKTAFFASDPNWGRILAAVGRASVRNLKLSQVRIFLDDLCIVEDGGRADSYTEQAGQAVMDQEEITVTIKLGRGHMSKKLLTCDFSYDYVRINAEYRT